MTEKLFSYGTLQNESVQLEKFGRKLEGSKDELLAYRLSMLEITDEKVVEISGERFHPVVEYTGDENDTVSGVVFSITPVELAKADEYEVDDYKRVRAKFKSGDEAWVYVSAAG